MEIRTVRDRRRAARRGGADRPLLRPGAAGRGVGRALAEELRARAHARGVRRRRGRRRGGRVLAPDDRSRRRALPTAGVTIVGVLPTHRRRGILRSMMRAQLDDVHERGEPLAASGRPRRRSTAATATGSPRSSLEFEIPRAHGAFRPGFEPVGARAAGRRRGGGEADAAGLRRGPARHAGHVRARGVVVGAPAARRPARVPLRRRAEELRGARVDGEPQAYAIYRLHVSFGNLGPETKLQHPRGDGDVAGRDRVDLALPARRRLDADGRRRGCSPVDHPLFLLLARPNLVAPDPLRRALGAARGRRRRALGPCVRGRRARSCSTCATSSARGTRAAGGSEGGEAARTDADADLALDVAELGSVYLGGFTFRDLWRAGPRRGAARGCDRRGPTRCSAPTSRPGAPRSSEGRPAHQGGLRERATGGGVGERVLEDVERVVAGVDFELEVVAGRLVLDGDGCPAGAPAPEQCDLGRAAVAGGERLRSVVEAETVGHRVLLPCRGSGAGEGRGFSPAPGPCRRRCIS